jgi:hypothetical protein
MCSRTSTQMKGGATHGAVGLLLAGEAEAGATAAHDVQGLPCQVHVALGSMLAVGSRTPFQAVVVLHIRPGEVTNPLMDNGGCVFPLNFKFYKRPGEPLIDHGV